MKRYRVRVPSKSYDSPGPDLLRPASNATQQFARVMGSPKTGWYTRRNPPGRDTPWSKWNGPISRAEVLQRANAFLKATPGAKFQVGRGTKANIDARAEMKIQDIKEIDLPGVKTGAELVADLARAHFGCDVGGFSCREYNNVPGSGWSDHAWGDAVDLDVNAGSPGKNDALTDWCVRMAREGAMGDVQQFIGSKGGKVYSFVAPLYLANLGGPPSHKTHVHVSYRQHFGADPNCR